MARKYTNSITPAQRTILLKHLLNQIDMGKSMDRDPEYRKDDSPCYWENKLYHEADNTIANLYWAGVLLERDHHEMFKRLWDHHFND